MFEALGGATAVKPQAMGAGTTGGLEVMGAGTAETKSTDGTIGGVDDTEAINVMAEYEWNVWPRRAIESTMPRAGLRLQAASWHRETGPSADLRTLGRLTSWPP
jgi:hypothetical protein